MHISEAFHCATRQNADRLFNFCGFYVIIYVSVFRFENKSLGTENFSAAVFSGQNIGDDKNDFY